MDRSPSLAHGLDQEMDENTRNALVQKCRDNIRNNKGLFVGLTDEQSKALRERYAVFRDEWDGDGFCVGSEVVLRDFGTPRPFLHLMASQHAELRGQWGSFWDQFGGGFSCVDTVLGGAVTAHHDTNYVPTAPQPQDVREFFVHEDGLAWPLFPRGETELDDFTGLGARFGLDVFRIEACRRELHGELSVVVHPGEPRESWRVRLTNRSQSPRTLSWFSRLPVNVDSYPFYYFVPRVVCQGRMEGGMMVFENRDQGNRHQRTVYFSAAPSFSRFDMMAERFDGVGRNGALPLAVKRGGCSNSEGREPYAGLIAGAEFSVSLQPGETQSWELTFGLLPHDKEERVRFFQKGSERPVGQWKGAHQRVQSLWAKKVNRFAIQTGDIVLDRYFNIWSRYQARNQARFVRALDKVGYRDILQDLLGVCDTEPEFVRSRLLEALRFQFSDGRAVRQYEKYPGGGHDERMYHDSPSWLADLLVTYISETGDAAILEEQVPYLNWETKRPSQESGSVYEHVLRGTKSLFGRTGHHGLSAIGYGDWNDAISGIGGKNGVSIWLSCAAVFAAGHMERLAGKFGRDEDAHMMRGLREEMIERINTHAWDGEWYLYAINDRGEKIGSRDSQEGKIHLNVNTWALFTGVAAAAGREAAVRESLRQLETPIGHMLLRPAYTQASRETVGRIADQAPGLIENASIYTHGEAFYLYALAQRGEGDAWLEALRRTLPSEQVADIATGPPHQQSNFFVGPDHSRFGENMFNGFTGSLAWYRRSFEHVLGVVPCLEGLRIDPRPPSSWGSYRVRKIYRGCALEFCFSRTGRRSVAVEGRIISSFLPARDLVGKEVLSIEVEF